MADRPNLIFIMPDQLRHHFHHARRQFPAVRDEYRPFAVDRNRVRAFEVSRLIAELAGRSFAIGHPAGRIQLSVFTWAFQPHFTCQLFAGNAVPAS